MTVEGYYYLFIFGPHRTGSTLLHKLLSNHPDVDSTPNDFDILRAYHSDGPGIFDEKQWKKLCDWNLQPIFNFDDFFRLKKMTRSKLVREVLDVQFRDSDKLIRLYKVPKGEMYLEDFRNAFGDLAKFVYIVRNPLAIMSSRKYWLQSSEGRWFSLEGNKLRIIEVEKTLDYIRNNLRRLFESFVIIDSNLLENDTLSVVTYEELVNRPGVISNTIVKILGGGHSKGLFKDLGPPYTSYEELLNKASVYKDAVDMWKSKLTETEIGLVYNTMQDFYDEYDFKSNEFREIFLSYLSELVD